MSQDQDRALYELARGYIKEQRRARRWGMLFQTVKYLLIILVVFSFIGSMEERQGAMDSVRTDHTALIDIEGVIASSEAASADKIVSALRSAMEARHSAAVILRINSPGGSPVQSDYVYNEIVRLREDYPDKKIYAVISDVAASGGYYIASAADEIYANPASLVGSIGVTTGGAGLASFGYVEAMEKLGIERRVITSGDSKNYLDPFSPQKPEQVAHHRSILNQVHGQFIRKVEQGRGSRIKPTKELYSGLIWTGAKSVELGLVDELASSSEVARDVIGVEKIVDYTIRPSYFEQFAEQFGTAVARVLLQAGFEERLQLR
ncbi:MAG: S49 family peptidase [Gammaproteobacteria bacterium]|nr:S49 family peptidase [Gammaproteobacteria bacterium]